MFNDLFDKVYLINMDKHTERLTNADAELKQRNIEYTRFSGIEINGGATQEDRENGCRESHMQIIQQAKDAGYKKIFIFEDDIRFNPMLYGIIKEASEFIKGCEYDLFYLGGNHNRTNPEKVSEYVVRVSQTFATHAYSVGSHAYDKILKFRYTPSPVDVLLTLVQSDGNSFCITPRIAYQREGFSSILNSYRNYDVVLVGE